jgi:hypothetical protein
MTDDRMDGDERPLDETLLEAATRYHQAGEVPREAIWARIEAARRAPRLVLADDEMNGRPPRVVPLAPPHRIDRRWTRWAASAAALAATLLVGVAIGRTSGGHDVDSTGVAPVGVASVPAATVDSVEDGARRPSIDATGGRGVAPLVADAGRGGRGSARPAPDAPRLGSAPDRLMPYQVAAVQHMSRAEALLTTFRAGARAGAVDEEVQPWARDLLSSTRLLLDSPAGQDPALRALLGDLELVLAQIVQLPAQRRAEEVQLIDRQLDADGVITRLRTAVPAGTPARGA